jgi:iron(III) transport system substrate-binding protein
MEVVVNRSVYTFIGVLCFVALFAGCKEEPAVTLYTSVDEPFAREVVAAFEKKTGIRVDIRCDKEAGKTTGLVMRIRAEKKNPQADVFWSSELFNTIQLAEAGLLAEYRPPADDIPERCKDPNGFWTAIGLRARVIGYNKDLVTPDALPNTWRQITDRRWDGRLGVADPRSGTTRGHFAAFLALWGEDEYRAFLDDLNAVLHSQFMTGNSTAADSVASGHLQICATDTDDVYVRQKRDKPIDMIYPDMGDGGTLLIPNSIAMIAGSTHPETARQLIDFLASAEVERMLAKSDSGNFPVRAALRDELGMKLPPETKLTYQQIAASMDQAIKLMSEVFNK